MKIVVGALLGLVVVLGVIVGVQRGLVWQQDAKIKELTDEVRPLRMSEKLMLSCSEEDKKWQAVARPVVQRWCFDIHHDAGLCANSGLVVDPASLRSALGYFEVRPQP